MNNLLIGVLLTSVLQVGEVIDRVTALAFIPDNHAQLTEYLDEINNRATPVIVVNQFFQDESGQFVYSTDRAAALMQALATSNHFTKTVFMFDEPLHNGILAGQDRLAILAQTECTAHRV